MSHGFRPFAKDLARRLVTLAVLFLLVSNLAAFVSRRVPDEALLRQVGFSGGIVYSYPVSSSTAACILLDEAAGIVSFAVVGNDRSLGEWYLQPYRSAWWSRCGATRPTIMRPLHRTFTVWSRTSGMWKTALPTWTG